MVSNQIVWEKLKDKKLSKTTLVNSLADLDGIAKSDINLDAAVSKIKRFRTKVLKLRGASKDAYLAKNFDLPLKTLLPLPTTSHTIDPLKLVCMDLINENEKIRAQSENKDKFLTERRNKVSELREKTKQLKRKLERSLKRKHTDNAHCPTIKRKRLSLNEQQLKLKLKQSNLRLMEHKRKTTKLQKCIKKLRKEKHQLHLQKKKDEQYLQYYKELQSKSDDIVDNLMKENKKLNKQVKELETSLQYTETLLQDNATLQVYDDIKGQYTPDMIKCVLDLTDLNVATGKVSQVIESVLHLAGIKANRLPHRTTVDNFIEAKLPLAQAQIGSVLADKETTLQTDETSKFGKKYGVYIVSDSDKNSYMLGLQEMQNKSAQTTLDIFKDILDDISATCNGVGQVSSSEIGKKLLCNIQSTMSDRASTEKCFNELLEQFRSAVLPDVVSNWEVLTNDEQKKISRMTNFFCSLHLLVSMAEVANSSLLKHERLSVDPEKNSGITESSAVNFVRICAKSFARGGDEKSGCYSAWNTFIVQQNECVPFTRYRGNRFNIIFVLAEVAYFHRNHIIHFLNEMHGTTNKLLLAVLEATKMPLILPSCRVLGLISKCVTGPFWRVVESCTHVLDLNEHYLAMRDFFTNAANDPTDFLSGKSPFDERYQVKDNVYQALISNEDNDIADSIARPMCQAMATMLNRLVCDHLPGGKYFDRTLELELKSASTPCHNIKPEFAFGILDFLVRYRPNATTLTNEAYLLYSYNKTSAWLDKQNVENKHRLILKARHEAPKLKKKFKARQQEIARQNREALRNKENKITEKRKKDLKRKESLTSKIVFYGLWQSHQDIDEQLDNISTLKEKREALKVQLQFRKIVLQQPVDDLRVFNLSEQKSGKSKNLTNDRLTSNLKQLVDLAVIAPNRPERTRSVIEGKRVEHRFADGCYEGRVISVVPGFPNWYNIVYDEDTRVYTYELLKDYAAGDLKIIEGTENNIPTTANNKE